MPFLDSSPWHFGQDAKSNGVSVQGSIEIWQAYISSSDLQAQYNSAKKMSACNDKLTLNKFYFNSYGFRVKHGMTKLF